MSAATIRQYTDPGCPDSFAAEAWRLRLQWLYRDQLAWEPVMVALRTEKGEWAGSERLAEIARVSGMPLDPRDRLWDAATIHACRAVVATRLRWPDREAAMLRRLRVLAMAGELLDDSDTLELAAAQAALPVAELAAYCAEPEVEAALRADIATGRPSATCDVLGTPLDGLERRPDPESAREVLDWAGTPLATAEVAAVCDRDPGAVRAELERTARFDGSYWS